MTFPILGGNSAVGGYSIDNSLRINAGDSAYLSRTQTAGNQKTFTASVWVKRSRINDRQAIFSASPDGSNECFVWFDTNDELFIKENTSGSTNFEIRTNRKFRDVSAFYHLVIAYDTSNSTSGDRIRLYVNGAEETSFADETQPTQNFDTKFNKNSQAINIGRMNYDQEYFGGYLAEINWIDGQQLTPSSFGEFDEDSGIWKPKKYSGSYGTNGFYLKFANSGSLGADSSGNGNNFTPSNLASTDQTTDTPTNNFATMSPLLTDTTRTTFSEGNLVTVNSDASTSGSTIAVSSGKWYCEMICTAKTASNAVIGICTVDGFDGERQIDESQNGGSGHGYVTNGTKLSGGASYGATWAVNDVMAMALDLDSSQNTITFFKNGASQGAINIDNALYVFANSNGQGSSTVTTSNNFGNPPHSISSGNADENGFGNFEYAPPSGHLALCTKNLSSTLSPTIDDGSAYFHTRLYSGTGSALSITNNANAGNFKPDWIWLKSRNNATNHNVFDSSRGQTKRLYPNLSDAEDTVSGFTLDTNGFSTGTSSVGDINVSGKTYVAWQWKVNGGTTSSNTSGNITSTVQVNATSGISIITYAGSGTAGNTVGHGLGAVPDIIIVKNRSSSADWGVWSKAHNPNASNAIRLNTTDAYGGSNGAGWWGDTAPTSSLITLGFSGDPARSENNSSGNNYVMICFKNIEGYSKFGKYTGNGNADGTFFYTGFKPSWLMVKLASGSGEDWHIFDSSRSTSNVVKERLIANGSSSENANDSILDFLSNGFKFRENNAGWNGSGNTYIYMAFAENPFVSSSGVPVTAR